MLHRTLAEADETDRLRKLARSGVSRSASTWNRLAALEYRAVEPDGNSDSPEAA